MLLPTLIAIPLLLIWILVLVDIFRRPDLHRGAKAAWIIGTLVLPLLGPIIYIIARPAVVSAAERDAVLAAGDEPARPSEGPTARHGPA